MPQSKTVFAFTLSVFTLTHGLTLSRYKIVSQEDRVMSTRLSVYKIFPYLHLKYSTFPNIYILAVEKTDRSV